MRKLSELDFNEKLDIMCVFHFGVTFEELKSLYFTCRDCEDFNFCLIKNNKVIDCMIEKAKNNEVLSNIK